MFKDSQLDTLSHIRLFYKSIWNANLALSLSHTHARIYRTAASVTLLIKAQAVLVRISENPRQNWFRSFILVLCLCERQQKLATTKLCVLLQWICYLYATGEEEWHSGWWQWAFYAFYINKNNSVSHFTRTIRIRWCYGLFVMAAWFYIYRQTHTHTSTSAHYLISLSHVSKTWQGDPIRCVVPFRSDVIICIPVWISLSAAAAHTSHVLTRSLTLYMLFATIYLIWRMCWGISPNTKSNLNCFVPVKRREHTRVRQKTERYTYTALSLSMRYSTAQHKHNTTYTHSPSFWVMSLNHTIYEQLCEI